MYINELIDKNMIYSVDKIRLKTFLTVVEFSRLTFRFKTVWKNYIKKEYTTVRASQFLYNYNIEIEKGQSFWFGFIPNSERKCMFNDNYKHNFTIEFNPNKLKDNKILLDILRISNEWYIKSFDLAIDVKVNILDLIIDSSGRHEQKIFSYGGDNKTIMLGKGDCRLKVYNKKRESNLDINYDLTRIEITRELDDFSIRDVWLFDFDDFFPKIYLNEYVYSLSDYKDKTLLAVLYAVQCGFPLKDLSRRYKEKVEGMLRGGFQLEFSRKIATEVVKNTIKYYFSFVR